MTKFEETVLKKLLEIESRISKLEGRAATWGAIAGALMAVIGEVILKTLK